MAKGYTKSMNRTKSAMTHLVALDTSLKELYKNKTGASPMRVPLSSLDGTAGKTSSILGASLKEKNVDLTRSMLDIPDQDTQQEEGMQESEVNKILGRASEQ